MKNAFTLVEIMIVVAIIGLLAAIAIPSFMRSRTTSQQNACIDNLRIIEGGKDLYSLTNGRTNMWAWSSDSSAFTDLVGKDLYVKAFPLCPASTTDTLNADSAAADYNVNPIGSSTVCTVFSATHFLQ